MEKPNTRFDLDRASAYIVGLSAVLFFFFFKSFVECARPISESFKSTTEIGITEKLVDLSLSIWSAKNSFNPIINNSRNN